MMDDAVEAMDRISELPHFIVHQIMSYLKTKEVARTSILSKKWNQLRISFPILVFDQKYFFPGGKMDYVNNNYFVTGSIMNHALFFARKIDENFCVTVKKFMEFVDSSLLRFYELKLRVQRLRLVLILLDVKGSAPMLDKWIGLAVENGVKELDFDNITHDRTPYTLPQTIFNANLITSLKLVWCRLEQKPSGILRLHSLKRLSLTRVCLDERLIQKITSDCPVLEDLSISYCWGFKRLRVSKAFKLKFMDIQSSSEEVEIVEISVPSLQELTLRFNVKRRPRIVEVARSPHLKSLCLMSVSFATDEEFNNLISKFPMLEDLWVWYCRMPGRIKISSNQLKKLLFTHCEDLEEIDVDIPNLLSLTYDFHSIPTTPINVPCPWKISFRCRGGGLDTHWFLKLKKFLGASHQIQNLSLFSISGKVVSNLEELGESPPPLALQVWNLELDAEDLDQWNSENLLDGVFWICYPRTLRVTVFYEEEYNFVKWIGEQLRNRDVNCCNSRLIKCWRHYLKDIRTPNNILPGVDGLAMSNRGASEFYLDWCVPKPNEKS